MTALTTEERKALAEQDVSYDPSIVDDMDKFELIRTDAGMKGRVVAATREVCGTGTRRVVAIVSPLDSNDKTHKPTVKWYIYPSLRNDKTGATTGHFGMYCTMRSLDPTFPLFGRKLKNDAGFTDAEGNAIDKAKYDAINREVKLAIAKKSVDLWNDPEGFLKEEEVFFTAKHKKGSNDKIYPEVKFTWLATEEPADVEIVYDNFVTQTADVEE